IESRLQQIDELGSLRDYDVVLKSAPRQPYVSVRQTYAGMEHVVAMLREVARAASARLSERIRGPMVVVAYSDFEEEDLDLEIGFSLKDEPKRSVTLPGRLEMVAGELPAVEHLATVVRSGPLYRAHLAFGALGLWMEAEGYRIAGPSREVFLELPFQR